MLMCRRAIEGIVGVFSIARIGQVQVIFRACFSDDGPPAFAPGPESLDVGLLAPDEIPWQEIAFPSVHCALNAWLASDSGLLGQPAGNPADDRRGVHPKPRPVSAPSGETAA